MVCVNRKSAANAIIKANGVLCVSSLGAEQIELSQMFAGVGRVPMNERFAGPHWSVLATGSPYCTQSRVALDCRVADIQGSRHPQRDLLPKSCRPSMRQTTSL